MKALIILCHPSEESFNHFLAKKIDIYLKENGFSSILIDLYKINFNPVLAPEEYQRKISLDTQVQKHVGLLEKSSMLIFIHPDWWGGPPAMLKGWIDRIFQPGVAYKYTGQDFLPKNHVPLLQNKQAFVFFTTNSTLKKTRALRELWKNNIFNFCGINHVLIKGLYDFHKIDNQKKQRWADHVIEEIAKITKSRF